MGEDRNPLPRDVSLGLTGAISHSLLQTETPRAYVRQHEEEQQGHPPKISSVKGWLLYAEEMWEWEWQSLRVLLLEILQGSNEPA